MLRTVVYSAVRKIAPLAIAASGIGAALASSPPVVTTASSPIQPLISDQLFIKADGTPPSEAECNAVGRRCFNPAAMANSYNYLGLQGLSNGGFGKTIAVVDSFGSSTIREDLGVFNTAFGLPHLCGETGPNDPSGNCPPTTQPRFDIIQIQGGPPPVPPPPNNGTGLEAHNLWDLEVSLDVEWAHATAPKANIMLVETPTAETLGVQGFQQMMNAEDELITSHKVDVISQSFGAGEGSFHDGLAALKQLRQTFVDAKANHVTVFASSGDGGSLNTYKEPVKNPASIPYASVIWPASDPLVTAVGGTYLCTNAETGLGVDTVSPPARCQPVRNPAGEREPAWAFSGGGYSIYFSKPDFQSALPTLPLGSTYLGSVPGMPVPPGSQMRGVPDIAYQASSATGVLVYMTEPNYPGQTTGGIGCPPANAPCSAGWWVVGGTSAASPQWAGLIAMADEMAGRDIGYINPALYTLADNATTYAADFFDDDTNSNAQSAPDSGTSGNCCQSSKGWDAVTGLGSPNAGNLIPALIAATAGS